MSGKWRGAMADRVVARRGKSGMLAAYPAVP
jgi:hypothetical protein